MMAERVGFGESLSQAKGAAGLRLRSQLLAKTGYLAGEFLSGGGPPTRNSDE